MESQVPKYNAFEVDENGHRKEAPTVITAKNDMEAVVRAMASIEVAGIEIYNEAGERVAVIQRNEEP
jgi:hypothetical protein